MKAKLNIPGCDAYVTDERPGTAKHPKLVLGVMAFGPMELVRLPGRVGMCVAAQVVNRYGAKLEGAEKALVDEFVRPML